jgi:phage FluMu gp28-like protein
MSGVIALHRALYFDGSLVLLLAPSERQSKELFAKVSDAYQRLRGAPPPASDRKLGMHLPNGSRIEALPGTEKTIRGFSGTSLLIVDEAARVDDELYFAVRPMLAVSGGTLMMLSTPYGRRGVFHREWTEGRGWERYEIPASEVPRISAEFLAEERAALPPWVFQQEYGCAFMQTGDAYFPAELVDAAISSDVKPLFGSG